MERSLDTLISFMAGEGEQSDRGCVNMRRDWHAKCDSITRIPSAAWAHPVEEHAGAEVDPLSELGSFVITTLPGLLKGNECECSRDYPARCT